MSQRNFTDTYRIVLVRTDPNYGHRFLKGASAAHLLKTYLEKYARFKENIKVEVIEINSCWQTGLDLHIQWILDYRPHLIGFSCYCWNIEMVASMARLLKQASPHILIAAGGPEVSFNAEEFLAAHETFDILVRGEGEETFCQLIDEMMTVNSPDMSKIPGLTYRGSGKIVSNPDRPPIHDLDAIPSPFLEGTIDLEKTDGEVMLETVRGCAYHCSFCLHTKGMKGLRSFSWERIEAELRFLCRHPAVEVIWVADPTFNADEERALRIIDLVLATNPHQGIAFELRAEMLTQRLIRRLSQLNLVDVGVGLQSINPCTARVLRRPANLELFQKNIAALLTALEEKNKTTRVDIDVIYGIPHDTFDGYKNTVDYALQLGGNVYYQPLRVFHGAQIEKQARGLRLQYMGKAPYNALNNPSFTRADMVCAYRLNAGLDFYQDGFQAFRPVMAKMSEILAQTPAQICFALGHYLWDRGLRLYFRVSNASPNDIPPDWRAKDFLAWLETVKINKKDLKSQLELLDQMKETLTQSQSKSGYFHAAI